MVPCLINGKVGPNTQVSDYATSRALSDPLCFNMHFMVPRIAAIAAAVLIAAVLVVVLFEYNIPNWLFEIVKQGPTERAIYALTPDLVVAHCGAPISDNTESHSGLRNMIVVSREMDYHGGTGTVTLAFVRTDEGTQQGRWVLNAMYDPVNHFRYDTGKAKLAALPCLAGK
jgi:hypothetical protein